ncbi:hypothetical protein GQX74_009614 [Glossina fuscipes]|nr:hypothetical protein GQX74_009614 [Glossina fuscipes]
MTPAPLLPSPATSIININNDGDKERRTPSPQPTSSPISHRSDRQFKNGLESPCDYKLLEAKISKPRYQRHCQGINVSSFTKRLVGRRIALKAII